MSEERGRLQDADPETLRCVCSNTLFKRGFAPTDSSGVVVDDGREPDHLGLAAWPRYQDDLYSLCLQCGRLYSQALMCMHNDARVLRLVNLREPLVDLSLTVMYENERAQRKAKRVRAKRPHSGSGSENV